MGTIASYRKFGLIALPAAGLLLAVAAALFVQPQTDAPIRLLRIGVLPDQTPEVLQVHYSPLLEFLAAETGAETRLVVPADYGDAVRLFRERQVDLAYFGGLTFVQARALSGALPLVMREIDTRFITWFVARPSDSPRQLPDFKGQRFSFGSRLSTSGHLMPRHFLQQQWRIEPESFFTEVSYSGAHDKTVMLVRDGGADLGAVNSAIARLMIADGRIRNSEIEVVWQTPPYTDYVWAVQAGMDESLQNRLRDAFLTLDHDDPRDRKILQGLGARVFLPADPAGFTQLEQVAGGLELLAEDAL